jgi:hypothetical protein
MDTQIAAMEPDAAVPLPPADTTPLAPPSREVTDEEFAELVHGALEAVGGTLLFKVRVGAGERAQLVAAASVGAAEARQFLLLSLPTSGGQLKVEMAARSSSPLAGIAASYAGLLEAFQAAA